MKTFRIYFMLQLWFCAFQANASLSGTWEGKLQIAPDSMVTVQFIIERGAEDEKYKAFLNVPNESSLRNIPATALLIDGSKMTLTIDEVGGRFVGSISDTELDGQWMQQGASFPLKLSPYVEVQLSEAQQRQLLGQWHGTLNIPRTSRKLAMVFNITLDDKQKLMASLDSPDQALQNITFDEVHFRDNAIMLKVANPDMSYHGILSDVGFTGEWTQGGSAPLNMVKGMYIGHGLDVPANVREQLTGSWYGQIGNAITIVFRFESREDGLLGAYLDSPDQGKLAVPISDVSMSGNKIKLVIDGFNSVFSGQVSAGKLSGDLVQDGNTNAVILQRGIYQLPTIQVPAIDEQNLTGLWKGIAGNTELLFRFKRDEDGEFRGYLDIPSQYLRDMPLDGVKINSGGEQFSFVVKGIGAQFDGSLIADKADGSWTMPGFLFPLVLEKIAK